MTANQDMNMSRVMQLLFGVDLNNPADKSSIVWLQTPAHDPELLANADFVFSPIPLEQPHMQLIGDLGTEGDEAVFDDGLIIETCSLTGLEYMDILGPTYISFETESDETLLQENLTKFTQTGKLPNHFTHPGTILNLAGLAPNLTPLKRTIINETGAHSWPTPPIIKKINTQNPQLSHYLANAIIMARKLGEPGAKYTFNIPETQKTQPTPNTPNIVLAHKDTEYRCMNTHTGRIYSLGYDMYRAALSQLNPKQYQTLPGEKLNPETLREALKLFHEKILTQPTQA